MKAVILAAGEGHRLWPLTKKTPKCLIPLAGRPLLDYWLENCAEAKVSTVYINGYYLAEQVAVFLDSVRHKYEFSIVFHTEQRLSGTGGFLRKLYHELKDEEFFFFCHGDNFTDLKIADFIRFHRAKRTLLSLALFHTETPSTCGIVEQIDANGLIRIFVEKPPMPKSDLASAAIFLMSPEVFADFPDDETIDFSKEVLLKYQNRMYGFDWGRFNIYVGTPESYRPACLLAEAQK